MELTLRRNKRANAIIMVVVIVNVNLYSTIVTKSLMRWAR